MNNCMIADPNESKFQEWRAALRAVPSRLLGRIQQRVDGSDMAQEGVTQLWQQGVAAGQVNKAYLTKVARGTASNLHRFHNSKCRSIGRETSTYAEPTTTVTPESVLQKRERMAWVSQQLSLLSDDEQRVVHAHISLDLSFTAIGAQLGKTERVVRYAFNSAIEKIARKARDAGA